MPVQKKPKAGPGSTPRPPNTTNRAAKIAAAAATTTSAKPAEPITSTKPAEPTTSAKPAEPITSAKPAEPIPMLFDPHRIRTGPQIRQDSEINIKKFTNLYTEIAMDLFKKIYQQDIKDPEKGYITLKQGQQIDESALKLSGFIKFLIANMSIDEGAVLALASIFLLRFKDDSDLEPIIKLSKAHLSDMNDVQGFCALVATGIMMLTDKILNDESLSIDQYPIIFDRYNSRASKDKQMPLVETSDISKMEFVLLAAIKFNLSVPHAGRIGPDLLLGGVDQFLSERGYDIGRKRTTSDAGSDLGPPPPSPRGRSNTLR